MLFQPWVPRSAEMPRRSQDRRLVYSATSLIVSQIDFSSGANQQGHPVFLPFPHDNAPADGFGNQQYCLSTMRIAAQLCRRNMCGSLYVTMLASAKNWQYYFSTGAKIAI